MRRAFPAALAISLLLVTLLATPLPASGCPPPFGIGDWTVTGTETLEDDTLLLDGSLTIADGGSLTISNSTLTIYSAYPEQHEVRVMAGGTLRILNGSVISSFDPDRTHGFWIERGATAEFRDSVFLASGIWYAEVSQQIIGGIVSYSDSVTIENCTFKGAHIALTFYAGAELVSSSFVQDYIGVISLSCPMEYRNCTFDSNVFAVWPYKSDSGFTDCTFLNNSIGISSDASTCRITGCRFTRQSGAGVYASAMMHWYMPPSTLFLEDCVFEGNFVGIGHYPDVGKNHLTIANCDFLNSSRSALEWGNRGWDGSPPPDYTLWKTSQDSRVVNSRSQYNGQMVVETGGNLTLRNSNLSIDCDGPGNNRVEVETGGRLALCEGSSLKAFNASFPYGLRCRYGSAFQMDGSLLRDCGWDSGVPEKAGPLLETSDVLIRSSTVDYNPVSVLLRNSHGGLVEGSYLRGLETCLDLNSSALRLQNSSVVRGWNRSASLRGSSLLECLNSTLDRRALELQDDSSRVNLSWYLDVRAVWEDGSPAAGAGLSVQNSTGDEVLRAQTGGDGWIAGSVLQEARIMRAQNLTFTPHHLNCSWGPVFNATSLEMNRSRSLVLVLADDRPPAVNITYPSAGSYLSSSLVPVSGTASDNLGVARVELVQDGYRRFTAFDSAGAEVPEVGWNLSLQLAEGFHSIEAVATDLSGNSASAFLAVVVDLVAPRIQIASPADGHLTNLSLQPVSGFMEPGTKVFLDGVEVETERDTFAGTVLLSEGDNLVTAIAMDRAGNSNTSAVRVTLDTIPPLLELTFPPEGLRTNLPMVDVVGRMEPGSEVSVNGRRVVLTGDPGTFRTAVTLPREVNLIAVDAVDPAGNHNLTVRKVILDTRPPFLRLGAPVDGLVTNRSSLLVAGTSEGGTLVSIGANGILLPGEDRERVDFSLAVNLQEGMNSIAVHARDAAGNQNSTVRHVVLDTRPPPLSLVSPEDGWSTGNATVFVTGVTEPGVLLTVNGQEVPVGRTGSFSLELRLASGRNRISVLAVDSAGNPAEAAVTVHRQTPATGETVMSESGPDWPFAAFLIISAVAAASEACLARRFLRTRRGNSSPGGGGSNG